MPPRGVVPEMKQDVSTAQQKQCAEYIARMATEMSRLAQAANLPVLSYLLDMASEEAALVQGIEPVVGRPRQSGEGRRPRVSSGHGGP
jgi:hypothetical protein